MHVLIAGVCSSIRLFFTGSVVGCLIFSDVSSSTIIDLLEYSPV